MRGFKLVFCNNQVSNKGFYVSLTDFIKTNENDAEIFEFLKILNTLKIKNVKSVKI